MRHRRIAAHFRISMGTPTTPSAAHKPVSAGKIEYIAPCPLATRSRIMNRTVFLAACCALLLNGCAVVAVADAAITVVAVTVKTTAKATGAVVGAVIP